MDIPAELKYTRTHEWVRTEGELLVVGITDPAQDMLGDLVFVGDVELGRQVQAGDTAGVVESVKAASDLYAPVTGEIVAFNEALNDRPQLLNQKPYEAWIFKLKPANPGDLSRLLDAAAYRAGVDAEKH
ncbi:MAG: glycine cleavage system protein GcvH [Burkholderiales bacterium]